MADNNFLYQKVAGDLAGMIKGGAYRPGERIPSVRQYSRQRNISLTTAIQAYRLLEDQGLIVVRPQSGSYVRLRLENGMHISPSDRKPADPTQVSVDRLVMSILRDQLNPNLVQFGAAIPDPDLLPTARLNRILTAVIHENKYPQNICGIPEGCKELRMEVAQRSFNFGCQFTPDDVLITSGCMEAVSLSLRVVCQPGDTVAVESPTYFNLLQALESQGLRALEIPTDPTTGVSLEALQFALDHHPVRACLFVPNYSNPLGSCMPDSHKEALAEMLAEREIPLIEDDIHGELCFSDRRPKTVKAYDRKGLVLLCSSFTKEIAPSYRVGWIAPGKFRAEIERLKMVTNMGTPILLQLAVARFLESGGYDHHLRRIRQAYANKMAGMSQAVLQHFPQGTCVSDPAGGFVLWVQLPESIDTLELYRLALENGISFVPGHVFSATPAYHNYLRLNAAYWSDKTAWAVQRLGVLANKMIETGHPKS